MTRHDDAATMGRARDEETRGELESLGSRTEETLRAARAVAGAREAIVRSAPWTIVAPGLALVAYFVARELVVDVPWWIVVILSFAPLAAWVVTASGRVLAQPLDPRAGLARLDRDLDAHDALRTAHDFLGRADRGAFEEATLVAAAPAIARAREHRLAPARHAPFSARTRAALLVAIAMCACWPWLTRGSAASFAPDETAAALARVDGTPVARGREDSARPLDVPPRAEREPRERKPSDASKGAKPEERAARAEAEREPRESTGKNGEGRSADASPSSNPSQSQGVPSSQSQPSTSADPSKAKTKKPKPKANKEDATPPKKKPLQESGATAGRGVGSGSSKNPGATDWASKDQVSTDEEPPPSEDEDVDDEDSDSEARGGLQPNLRDRRPAVNRDLTIGFGNQPNPDANGRGGPSEQKKSRGVASLVLGVPIPDHVKGRPNPGRTKITQERVEPRAEDATTVAAGARGERTGSIGPIARRTLAPWTSTLVKNWFQRQRRQETKTP